MTLLCSANIFMEREETVEIIISLAFCFSFHLTSINILPWFYFIQTLYLVGIALLEEERSLKLSSPLRFTDRASRGK